MIDFLITNVWLVAVLPLLSAIAIIFLKNFHIYDNKNFTAGITLFSSFIGIVWSILLLFSSNYFYEITIPFINIADIKLGAGILVDNLSVLMLVIVSTISFIVQMYSRSYMDKDVGFHRFFIYLNLFNFAMLSLVLSPNLLQMYVFWELVGLASYLLIAFWVHKPSAIRAGTKAFIINRIGDFGFLASMVAISGFSFWFWKFNDLAFLSFSTLSGVATSLLGTTTPVVFFFICLGFVLAMCAKSAQLPLHTWLADAMEGPTPISALIHAATMVAAGVFLIARVYPLLNHSPLVMIIIAWIGGITAILMAIIALFQNDIKKVLAFSTSSQLGLMILALGVGGYSAGIFHLTTHAYFKALLFLSAGAIIHSVGNIADMRFLGGLRKTMPFVANVYLIGVCAISGILFSGFWSKEAIFSVLLDTKNFALLAIALLASLLTIIYMFRTYIMTFEGEYRGHKQIGNVSWGLKLPLILLSVPSICLGWFLNEPIKIFIENPYYILSSNSYDVLIASSIGIIVLGLFVAIVLYYNGEKEKIRNKVIRKIRKYAQRRFYFDEMYSFIIAKPFLKFAKYLALFDKYVVDGVVNLFGFCTQMKSKILLYFQNGNILKYSTVGVLGLAVMMFLFLIGFSIYILGVGL